MENIDLGKLLEFLGFEYKPHRGTIDTFIKGNIEIKVPYVTVIKDGKTTHMIPAYDLKRIDEVVIELENN
jgi:hypothetical protein